MPVFFSPNSDQDKFLQIANLNSAHQTQANPLTWIQKLSCSENELCVPRLQDAMGGRLSTSVENMQGSKEIGTEGIKSRWVLVFFRVKTARRMVQQNRLYLKHI